MIKSKFLEHLGIAEQESHDNFMAYLKAIIETDSTLLNDNVRIKNVSKNNKKQ